MTGAQKSACPTGNDYRQCSFWLETAEKELVPRTSLGGPAETDVAILGAGFTGLWTAYYLLRREPSLRVVVLEAEIAGFGASGRNGGWLSAKPVGVRPILAQGPGGAQPVRGEHGLHLGGREHRATVAPGPAATSCRSG